VAWVAAVADALAAGRAAVLALVVQGPLAGGHMVVGEDGALLAADLADGAAAADGAVTAEVAAAAQAHAGAPRTVAVAGHRVYLERFEPPPELLVVGAGHVGQAIAQVGGLMGFRVTVLDDRPDFANPARLSTADSVVCDAFVPALRRLSPGPRHHVVLVTRGHSHDADCLQEVVARPVAYIGMIGSQTRIGHVFRLLAEAGFDQAVLEKVHAPIGLDLGARTPAEIAVAVAAELVLLRRGGTGQPLSQLGPDKIHRKGDGP
jgi:xanthine dehydrogenase accessory factor